jgi:hypothetical protein
MRRHPRASLAILAESLKLDASAILLRTFSAFNRRVAALGG